MNKLFSIKGLYILGSSFMQTGANIGFILHAAARLYQNNEAFICDNKSFTYQELYIRTQTVAVFFKKKIGSDTTPKVAFMCKNSPEFIFALFAAGLCGCNIYLLNPDLPFSRFSEIDKRIDFDWIIHGMQEESFAKDFSYSKRSIDISILQDLPTSSFSLQRTTAKKIIVLTSGTTGVSKTAARKTNPINFFLPFITLLRKLKLNTYDSLFCATPLFHGFGLAAMFVAFGLGKKVFMMQKFDAREACRIIEEHRIQVVTVVPVMLQWMIEQSIDSLTFLKCIVSGGARLEPRLVQTVFQHIDCRFFNIYGTSEAGICIMADTDSLKRFPNALGKPIPGAKVKLLDGQLFVKCRWSTNPSQFIRTGDTAYKDADGNYILTGRTDDMIISGGENVYPYELEEVLMTHPAIDHVIVKGVDDSQFGQRLVAFITPQGATSEENIKAWLKPLVPKHWMPSRVFSLDAIPYNSLGKADLSAYIKTKPLIQ